MRKRLHNLVLALGTVAVGLMVHFGGGFLPPRFRDSLGDALWAMMTVWWVGVATPRLPLPARAAAAMAICAAVEISQQYHTPWLDSIRSTTAGHLVLGSGYDPRDFPAYAAGIVVAVLLAKVVDSGRLRSG